MAEKREYSITKISDQKEKKYTFFRNLEIGENDLPTKEELDNLIDIEDNNKSVALFIGYDFITKICLKRFSKFKRLMLEEYVKGYEEGIYKQLYFDTTTEEKLDIINKEIQNFKDNYSYRNITSSSYQRSRNINK